MRNRRPAPLPLRDGVDATRVVLRSGEGTVGDAMLAAPACAGLTAADLWARAERGQVLDVSGERVDLAGPATPGRPIYFYRDLPTETEIPFELDIIHVDDDLVVVDKPHFLATMPRGAHVVQTALVRLRRQLDNPVLSPVHRLDRLTAGVLMFSARPAARAPYQQLFAERLVSKEYRARAPIAEGLDLPVTVRSRIMKDAGDLRARTEPGPENAISTIDLVDTAGDRGIYRLLPQTGRTHQLRVHMSGLGVPIDGDPLYPQVRPELAAAPDHGDFSEPLQLLAYAVEFDDPLSGARRRFVSGRSLG
ncbi:pseudouridine synthase [Gordonia rubripertincta]|uniref:RNA pseudouridylate synthase n=1 Tax=Gordonia rubripertincta TaxID=36822 RepID=A0ABT4MW06_GORRU|nr:pseudouridine synthase [Gordonia rubripertincta]MCZ4551183.1 pseudouridine synthase [Gordonia rubripertincta]